MILRHNRRMLLVMEEAVVLGTGVRRHGRILSSLFLKTFTECCIAYQNIHRT